MPDWDVSKLCGGLYFKKTEELSWTGYTFPKFKVSGLNITSDLRLLVETCLVTCLDWKKLPKWKGFL